MLGLREAKRKNSSLFLVAHVFGDDVKPNAYLVCRGIQEKHGGVLFVLLGGGRPMG